MLRLLTALIDSTILTAIRYAAAIALITCRYRIVLVLPIRIPRCSDIIISIRPNIPPRAMTPLINACGGAGCIGLVGMTLSLDSIMKSTPITKKPHATDKNILLLKRLIPLRVQPIMIANRPVVQFPISKDVIAFGALPRACHGMIKRSVSGLVATGMTQVISINAPIRIIQLNLAFDHIRTFSPQRSHRITCPAICSPTTIAIPQLHLLEIIYVYSRLETLNFQGIV